MNEIYKKIDENHLSMDSSMEDLQLSLCRIHEFKEFFKQTLLGQQIENFRTYFAILAKDVKKVQPWKRFLSYFDHNVQQPKLTIFYNHDDVDNGVLVIKIPSSPPPPSGPTMPLWGYNSLTTTTPINSSDGGTAEGGGGGAGGPPPQKRR
jgi:hypothetical protein